ncbi:unnamed protein product [Scytosiphon promiscuus]
MLEQGTEDSPQANSSLQRMSSTGGSVGTASESGNNGTKAVHVDIEASMTGITPISTGLPKPPRTRQDSISGGSLSNPPFLLPDSEFPSPASGIDDGTVAVAGVAGEVDAIVEDASGRRRSSRKSTGPDRDELFRQRLKRHRQRDMLFELREDGTYDMKEMTIREVFNYVQEEAKEWTNMGRSPAVDGRGGVCSAVCRRVGGANLRTAQASCFSAPDTAVPSSSPSHTSRPCMARRGAAVATQMSNLNLHLRDMRQLFSPQAKSEPAISVRRNCVLVNFETLRGIVLVDRLLLVVDPGADSILLEVRKALSESHDDVYEFELKAVEALLSVSSKRLEREVREVERPVAEIVTILEGSGKGATSAKNNDKFRVLLNTINVLENRAKARRRALLMVLEDDTDLAMMNLTRMCQSPEDYLPPLAQEVLEDHEEMELLLEAYLQDINSIYNVLELLQGRARSTEALVMVKLDIARNRILTAELIFSMASTCLTVGALVSGVFGMNMKNGMESNEFIFKVVAIGTVCACSVTFFTLTMFFYRHGILVS